MAYVALRAIEFPAVQICFRLYTVVQKKKEKKLSDV